MAIDDLEVPPPPATPQAPLAPANGFTQALVDDLVGKAREAGRTSAYKYVEKQLGVSLINDQGVDLTGLKAIVKEATDKRSQDGSKVEELTKQLTTAQSQIAQREQERDTALADAKKVLRQGELKVQALKNNFKDPDDVLRFFTAAQLDSMEVDLTTGTVTGIEDAVKQLAEAKTYLLNTVETPVTPVTPPALPATPLPTDERALALQRDEERKASIREQAQSAFG